MPSQDRSYRSEPRADRQTVLQWLESNTIHSLSERIALVHNAHESDSVTIHCFAWFGHYDK